METGIYIRICRGTKWQNLDIAECTEDELRTFLASKEKVWLINLILTLLGINNWS